MIPVSPPADWLLVIGSYTEPYGAFRAVGEGVSLVRPGADGQLELLDQLPVPNPSYLKVDHGRVRATLETDDARAGVATIEVSGGRLVLAGTMPSPGRIVCHLDISPDGQWLGGACYGSGEVFTRRLADGRPIAQSGATLGRRGSSVNPERQASAHPHAVRFSPDGRWLVVPDLGTDEVTAYPFDAATGTLGEAVKIWRSAPGSGPRLVLFSPDSRYVLLVHEISSEVISLAWEDGTLTEIGRLSSLGDWPFAGTNTAAGLRWHPDGHSFGVSNRGAHAITLFDFDPATGRIAARQQVPSGGEKPRDFEFTPCGNFLIASNQNSDSLVVYSLVVYSLACGRAEDTGQHLAVRSPSCVRVHGPCEVYLTS
jgi:6-phosphogluconolactonase